MTLVRADFVTEARPRQLVRRNRLLLLRKAKSWRTIRSTLVPLSCFWMVKAFPLTRPRDDLVLGVKRLFAKTGDRPDEALVQLDGVFDLVLSV